MVSRLCPLDGSQTANVAAIEEAETFAHRCGLAQRHTLCLRLLAEELLGMAGGVLYVTEGSFWIEREGICYRLYLTVCVPVGEKAGELLLGAATSGENVFYKGFTGKLRQMADWLSRKKKKTETEAVKEWSLKKSRQNPEGEEKAAIWDELEKSILSRLSDDILVGIRADGVSVTVIKVF